MKYAEAVKKLSTDKPRENYLLLTFGYGNKVILPYKDGSTLLSMFLGAEKFLDDYGKPKRIVEFDKESITCQVMPHQEYRRLKLAALLQITPEELKEYEEQEANKPPET